MSRRDIERVKVWNEKGKWHAQSNWGSRAQTALGSTAGEAADRAVKIARDFMEYVVDVVHREHSGDCSWCCSHQRILYVSRLGRPPETAK